MPKWHKEEKQCSGELNDEQKSEVKVNEDDGNGMFSTHTNDLMNKYLKRITML